MRAVYDRLLTVIDQVDIRKESGAPGGGEAEASQPSYEEVTRAAEAEKHTTAERTRRSAPPRR